MQRPQPRTDDERDELEEPERVPSLLSARELQAPVPAENESPASVDEEPSEKKHRKTPASANQKRPRAR